MLKRTFRLFHSYWYFLLFHHYCKSHWWGRSNHWHLSSMAESYFKPALMLNLSIEISTVPCKIHLNSQPCDSGLSQAQTMHTSSWRWGNCCHCVVIYVSNILFGDNFFLISDIFHFNTIKRALFSTLVYFEPCETVYLLVNALSLYTDFLNYFGEDPPPFLWPGVHGLFTFFGGGILEFVKLNSKHLFIPDLCWIDANFQHVFSYLLYPFYSTNCLAVLYFIILLDIKNSNSFIQSS